MPLAIDELTLVALLGAFADGETVVRGAGELRLRSRTGSRRWSRACAASARTSRRPTTASSSAATARRCAAARSTRRATTAWRCWARWRGWRPRRAWRCTAWRRRRVSYPGFEATRALAGRCWAHGRRDRRPAGAGKSSVARAVADALGFTYLNSGAMYRAVGLLTLRDGGAASEHAERLRARARRPRARRRRGRDRRAAHARGQRGRLEGGHQPAACARRSCASSGELLADGDWVAEGRDIGTVVAPDAAGEGLPDRRARGARAPARAPSWAPTWTPSCATRRCATPRTRAASTRRSSGAGRGRAGHHRAERRRGRRADRRAGAREASMRAAQGGRGRLPQRRQVDARQPPVGHARGGRARAGRASRATARRWRPTGTGAASRCGHRRRRHRGRGRAGRRDPPTRRWRRSPTPSWPCWWWTRAPACGPGDAELAASCAAGRCRSSWWPTRSTRATQHGLAASSTRSAWATRCRCPPTQGLGTGDLLDLIVARLPERRAARTEDATGSR